MKATVMQQQTAGVAKPVAAAIARALEKLTMREMREKLASGVFRLVDDFAGIDRLDRAELDETDEDALVAR